MILVILMQFSPMEIHFLKIAPPTNPSPTTTILFFPSLSHFPSVKYLIPMLIKLSPSKIWYGSMTNLPLIDPAKYSADIFLYSPQGVPLQVRQHYVLLDILKAGTIFW